MPIDIHEKSPLYSVIDTSLLPWFHRRPHSISRPPGNLCAQAGCQAVSHSLCQDTLCCASVEAVRASLDCVVQAPEPSVHFWFVWVMLVLTHRYGFLFPIYVFSPIYAQLEPSHTLRQVVHIHRKVFPPQGSPTTYTIQYVALNDRASSDRVRNCARYHRHHLVRQSRRHHIATYHCCKFLVTQYICSSSRACHRVTQKCKAA
jgi:hypothetical protein